MFSAGQKPCFLTMPNIKNSALPATEIRKSADMTAVRFSGVCKEYRLYNSLSEQAMDVLGFSWLRFWRSTQYRTFTALDGIDLEIKHGERVGIIGSNGAGKTTLLKLITGNFSATYGQLQVNGDVQALMQTGLGFHGEFTGYENIRSSLLYSGLSGNDLEFAVQDIIDFCELGDFLYQPVKTYSLGMRTRLQFAAATAIKPDIVIVDEVLGAGDAYFNAKSSDRMAKLAKSGCTLLIVSHSMQQVLQFCRRVVWIEKGRIIEDNEALPVVKAYERAMFEKRSTDKTNNNNNRVNFDTGVSRWARKTSNLFIKNVRLLNGNNEDCAYYESGESVTIEIKVQAKEKGQFPCIFVVLVFNSAGAQVTWHASEKYMYNLNKDETACVQLHFDRLLLTGDSYMISTAIFRSLDVLNKQEGERYDLLSRSFEFSVANDFSGSPAIIHHPAYWSTGPS
jgi:lipopolysaccharide transport system ATP-binding protein